MPVHRWLAPAFRLGTMVVLAFGISACSAPPPASSLVAAADPGVRVPATRYRSVMTTQTLRLVEPQPWQDLNRNVAPPPPNPKGQEP